MFFLCPIKKITRTSSSIGLYGVCRFSSTASRTGFCLHTQENIFLGRYFFSKAVTIIDAIYRLGHVKKRRFQFLKMIATGGFGEVYLCKEINANGIDRLVAVKVLKSDWVDNIDVSTGCVMKQSCWPFFDTKTLSMSFDLTSINGRASIIMEYVEGVDMSIIIETMRSNRRRTPISVSLQVCAKVAAALDAAYNQSPFPGEAPLQWFTAILSLETS